MQLKVIYHVFQNKQNHKTIAMVFEKNGRVFMNLKLTADHVDELIQLEGVKRGFYMNKKYWVTLDMNQTELSHEEVINMLKESARLIVGK